MIAPLVRSRCIVFALIESRTFGLRSFARRRARSVRFITSTLTAGTIILARLPRRRGGRIDRANRHDFKPGDRLLFAGAQTFTGNLILGATDAGTPAASSCHRVLRPGTRHDQSRHRHRRSRQGRRRSGSSQHPLRRGWQDKKQRMWVAFVNTLPGNVRMKHIRIMNIEGTWVRTRIQSLPLEGSGAYRPPTGCGVFVGGDPDGQEQERLRRH